MKITLYSHDNRGKSVGCHVGRVQFDKDGYAVIECTEAQVQGFRNLKWLVEKPQPMSVEMAVVDDVRERQKVPVESTPLPAPLPPPPDPEQPSMTADESESMRQSEEEKPARVVESVEQVTKAHKKPRR